MSRVNTNTEIIYSNLYKLILTETTSELYLFSFQISVGLL